MECLALVSLLGPQQLFSRIVMVEPESVPIFYLASCYQAANETIRESSTPFNSVGRERQLTVV